MKVFTPLLTPWNDVGFVARLYRIDTTSGDKVPLLAAVVRAYLTNDPDPATAPPNSTLIVNVPHLVDEKWLVSFDGVLLTPTALDTLFLTATPYVVVETTDTKSIRIVAPMAYSRKKTVKTT